MGRSTLYICVLLCFAFAACKSNKGDKLREEAEARLKSQMDDPSSYEFVGIQPWDSTRIGENIDRRRKDFKHEIEMATSEIGYQNSMRSLSGPYDKQAVLDAKSTIILTKRKLQKLEEIEKRLGDSLQMAASYSFKWAFRAKNTFGAKVMNEYTLQTGPKPDYKLLNIASTPGQMQVMPGGFPGENQLLKVE